MFLARETTWRTSGYPDCTDAAAGVCACTNRTGTVIHSASHAN